VLISTSFYSTLAENANCIHHVDIKYSCCVYWPLIESIELIRHLIAITGFRTTGAQR
jgi:hypothetical protein